MKTRAVRLYGARDLRLEEFELPPMKDDEILIRVVSDSVCMSTYKTAMQGAAHLRVPEDVAKHPVIIGHEFCGEITAVGSRWADSYAVGEKVIMPPVMSYMGGPQTIGYSFQNIGGASTYSLVAADMISHGHLIKMNSDAFFNGSLVEPASCVLRGYKGTFHLDENFAHLPGVKPGGRLAILAGCGPMGLAAIDCALHRDVKPSLVVVTDLDETRLKRAKELFPPESAEKDGVRLIFSGATEPEALMEMSGGKGYDDVFIYAPVPAVVELGDRILAFDGCLNFFAGPTDKNFQAGFNFYNVHYAQHHVAGTSGSTVEDMKDIVALIDAGKIHPAVMVTHIGGMDAVIDTTLRLPQVPGGKKLIYTHIHMPLTAISEFEQQDDPRFRELAVITKANRGLWCAQAERYLLEHFS